MTQRRAVVDEDTRTKLPTWLQCIVAVVGITVLAGPALAVVWYR